MTKAELRIKYKMLRKELSEEVIHDLSIDIANQLLKLDIWHFSFYHLFLTIEHQKEVTTDYILNILSGKDKNIVISKSNFDTRTLQHFLLNDATTLKLNQHNIPEPVDGIEIDPSKIEVVFVPLLAYDQLGNRVGYGKGFYDKFLAQCKPSTLKIGLSFFNPEPSIADVSTADMPLDFCITPKNILTFK